MKKHYFSEKDTVSVYQFMNMCGLEVEYKKNILLSHKAMMRKLRLRSGMVTVPKTICFETMFHDENVKKGQIVLVRDDYNKVLAYNRPRPNLTTNVPQTKEEKEKRREELLEEYMKEEHETIKPGYQKYLNRKGIMK